MLTDAMQQATRVGGGWGGGQAVGGTRQRGGAKQGIGSQRQGEDLASASATIAVLCCQRWPSIIACFMSCHDCYSAAGSGCEGTHLAVPCALSDRGRGNREQKGGHVSSYAMRRDVIPD